MKHIWKSMLAFAAAGFLFSATALAESKAVLDSPPPLLKPIEVFIDKQKVFFNENPIIENGTTLVQFRPVFEKLGLSVQWDAESKTVTGTKGSFRISLQIGNDTALVQGKTKKLEQPPQLINGHTFIPLRFVGEAVESSVTWDQEARSVLIASTLLSYIQEVLYADEQLLLYEGGLHNGKRNGLGKLLLNGKTVYEGFFSDNQFDGQGKLYDPSGKQVLYNGHWNAGRMNGQGVLYGDSGKKLYEGLWENGLKNGYGELFSEHGFLIYSGKFKNDRYEGDGVLYDSKTGKLLYRGFFANGLQEGTGNRYDSDGRLRYSGEFVAGLQHGKGKSYHSDGLTDLRRRISEQRSRRIRNDVLCRSKQVCRTF